MAKKQGKKIENELDGGTLSHNPFAALRGGAGSTSSSRPPGPAPEATPAAGKSKPAARPSRSPTEPRPKIVVRFEAKGHGGKTVTRVSGLALQADELATLATRIKKAMGTGARVEEGDVLVQGKLVDRLVTWLAKNGHTAVVRGN